jgi:hypothetical protein
MQNELNKKPSVINYPRIDLYYSLEKTKQLAKQIGNRVLPEIEIAKQMGYKELTGRAIAVVSALKKYRLLEKQGNGFAISQLAKKIFDPKTSIEMRHKSVQEAAFSPVIFARLYEKFQKRLPSAHELDEFLEAQNIIAPTRKRIITNYQKTFEFAAGQQDDFFLYHRTPSTIPFEKETTHNLALSNSNPFSETVTGTDNDIGNQSGQTLTFPLVGNVEAKVIFSREIEGRHIDSLIQYLQLHKSQNFPEKG